MRVGDSSHHGPQEDTQHGQGVGKGHSSRELRDLAPGSTQQVVCSDLALGKRREEEEKGRERWSRARRWRRWEMDQGDEEEEEGGGGERKGGKEEER